LKVARVLELFVRVAMRAVVVLVIVRMIGVVVIVHR
jgi:hypothetical protein